MKNDSCKMRTETQRLLKLFKIYLHLTQYLQRIKWKSNAVQLVEIKSMRSTNGINDTNNMKIKLSDAKNAYKVFKWFRFVKYSIVKSTQNSNFDFFK